MTPLQSDRPTDEASQELEAIQPGVAEAQNKMPHPETETRRETRMALHERYLGSSDPNAERKLPKYIPTDRASRRVTRSLGGWGLQTHYSALGARKDPIVNPEPLPRVRRSDTIDLSITLFCLLSCCCIL